MPKIRKMKITDEDGKKYEVEEEIVSDEVVEENPEEHVPEHEHVDEGAKVELTDDEIKALKDLAACAPQLMSLIKQSANDEEVDPQPQPGEEEHPAEEIEDDDDEVIEEKEKAKVGDSIAKSIGATPKKKLKDSKVNTVTADDINSAWSNRYK